MIIPNRIHKTVDVLKEVAIAIPNPVKNYRIAAAVLDKNSIVSIGVNSYKTSPFQLKYGRNPYSMHIHAEVAAIKNALRRITVYELGYCDIVVVRLKKMSFIGPDIFTYGLAKPCSGCVSCINAFGIKKVYHTTDYYSTDSAYVAEMET